VVSSEISELKDMVKEFGLDLRTVTGKIGDMGVAMEAIRGDIRVIRAERPAREEISQIIHVALENCAGRHNRKDSSDRVKRPPTESDLLIKVALGAIGLAGVALAILQAVIG
jgi:hypothetical protein